MVPVLLIVSLVATGYLMTERASSELENEIKLSKAAGLPVSPEDMASRKVPPSENAAGHYQVATNALRSLDPKTRQLFRSYLTSTPDQMDKQMARLMGTGFKGKFDGPAIDRMLKEWEPVLTPFKEGSKKPHLNYDRPWYLGIGVAFPEYSELREISTAYEIAAQRDAAKGRPDEAIARLRAIRNLARQLYEEPTVIGQLVGTTISTRVNSAAVRLQIKFGTVPGLYPALKKFLAEPIALPDVRHGFWGETFFAVFGMEQIAKEPQIMLGYEPDGSTKFEDRLYRVAYLRKKAQAMTVRRYRETYLAIPEGAAASPETARALEELDEKFMKDQSLPARLASRIVTSFRGYATVARNLQSSQVLCQAAVDAIAELQMTRKLPTRIDYLEAGTKRPLKIKPTAKGFIIYGFGRDGVDDGGDRARDRYIEIDGEIVRVSGN